MRHSETIGAIAKALAAAQLEYVPVPKNKTAKVKMKAGGEFSYNYADLADCLSMALPRLSKNGIGFLQPNELSDGVKLRVTTLLVHESGEWMQSDGIEISEEGDPQQFGAEATYFRRYDGCAFIGIAPDEDTDAQQAGPRTRKVTPAQVTPNPTQPAPEQTGSGTTPSSSPETSAILHSDEPDIRPKSQRGNPIHPSQSTPSATAGTKTATTNPSITSDGVTTEGKVVGAEPSITAPQVKRFFAIAKSALLSDEQVKQSLASIGLHCHRDSIPKSRYNAAVDAIDPEFKFHTRT